MSLDLPLGQRINVEYLDDPLFDDYFGLDDESYNHLYHLQLSGDSLKHHESKSVLGDPDIRSNADTDGILPSDIHSRS